MKTSTQIKCPNCGTAIDVQDILAHQLEEDIRQKYQLELEATLKAEKQVIEERVKARITEEQSEQLQVLQRELNEKSDQVKELNKTRAEIEKLKRDKEEMQEKLEADTQQKINEAIQSERGKIKKAEEEKNNLRLKELQQQLEDQKKLTDELKTSHEQLEKAKKEFEEQQKQAGEILQEQLEEKLKQERKIIEERIKTRLTEEQSEQLQILQKELIEKSEQVKELNRTKAEIERLKREKEEAKEAAEAEAQKKVNEIVTSEREKIRKAEEEKNELRFRELQKQLEDQKKLTEEMKRKQEQGSMQLQGEVQELAIEEWLMAQFPLDTIEEIKKGARGGDCIQVVHTRNRQNCGKIYYESKRTKDFHSGWIEKFKADMRDKAADVGVLVTETMPAGFERMGIIDGVWVCSFDEFKSLCAVLRESVIQLSNAISSQENKGDKMHMLYDYLTSNTFRMQVEAIVEGFSSLKIALESEKRSMQRIWKEREKQIEKVITNTIDMYGSIKGIAGKAIQEVKALELPEGVEIIEENEG